MGSLNISTIMAGCLALATLGLANCSSRQAPEPSPQPPAKTVFDPLTRQVDRAREVQQTVDQNADSVRKALDAQERGDPPP